MDNSSLNLDISALINLCAFTPTCLPAHLDIANNIVVKTQLVFRSFQ